MAAVHASANRLAHGSFAVTPGSDGSAGTSAATKRIDHVVAVADRIGQDDRVGRRAQRGAHDLPSRSAIQKWA